jgi:DNA-binding NtrC family response regulator
MKKQPAIETHPPGTMAVLSVSPMEEDHASLQNIFNHSNWILHKSLGLASATDFLRTHEIPVVLCECDLKPGTWRDLMEQISRLSDAPSLIVTSRLADNSLWSEVLNLGAYDLMAKPFERDAVFRCLSLAWWHWKNHHEALTRTLNVMQAAS